MDRERDYLSTAEAARIAGVSAASVKRWADEGTLPCIRTAGGHRRFLRDDVERLLALAAGGGASAAGPEAEAAQAWVKQLLISDPHALRGALYEARARLGSWYAAGDELAHGLVELGLQWQRGRVSILEEHGASERLHRALAQVAGELYVRPEAPACLLVAADGDDHLLGLGLAELCLREAGWNTLWAGRRTPTSAVLASVKKGALGMVAASASAGSRDRSALKRQARALAAGCARHRVRFLMGGSGEWPDHVPGGTRVKNLRTLHRFLAGFQESA